MSAIAKILVGTDLNQNSGGALRHGSFLANRVSENSGDRNGVQRIVHFGESEIHVVGKEPAEG